MPSRNSTVRLGGLLDPRSVAANCVGGDAEDVLRLAAALLVGTGAVTLDYADAVVARELEYPTGLLTEPAGVALPHADIGVVRPAMSMLSLRSPVMFREMGTGEGEVPVRLVLLLAIPPGDAHVQAIGHVAELIQQPTFIAEALGAPTPEALYAMFQRWTSRTEGKE